MKCADGMSLVNTIVAARSIGRAALRTVDTDNTGTDFGFAAHSIKSLKWSDGKLSKLEEPGEHHRDGDFVVGVV